MPLTDEVVLITGATAGIGEACAWRFAEGGAKLILLGRRGERLKALAAALQEKYGTLSHTLQFDVQDIAAIAALPDQLPPSHREVSILINNAGLALGTAGADANDMADVMTMINTNVTAVMAFTRAFLPGFRMRGKGHLINVGSIAGHEAYGGGSAYCATKHAVDAFTTAARHDLVGTPIRVTAISPGDAAAGSYSALLGPSRDQTRPSHGGPKTQTPPPHLTFCLSFLFQLQHQP
jgi:NADP-dependent 3-hydroxy acid dehydrogenase YdfG